MPKIRRHLLLAMVSVVSAFLLLTSVAMAASSVTWEGITWGAVSGTEIDVVNDNLVVTDNNGAFPAAHYNTSTAFRGSPSQSVTFTMIDEGPGTVAGGIYIEYESSPAGLTLGPAPGYDNYVALWTNYDDIYVVVDTHIRRSAGEHTFEVGLRADGTVDFWIDGRNVASAPDFGLEYFGDVYLRARGGMAGATVTYTAYAEGTSYAVPASKDECKDGGWQDFSDPAFENQGQCVSFVMTVWN